MDYKGFIKLNERSKRINKSKRMIYVSNVQKVNKRDCIEFLDWEVDEELIGLMPEEVYVCDYEKCGVNTPYLFEILMSTLMTKIISGELWVCNPEIFSKVDFSEVPILPRYTLVEFNYDNDDDDKSAMVLVDGAIFGFFCLAELLGKSAESDIYTRTLKNMRSFGFITLPIEDKLKATIIKGLEEVRRDVDVVLGVGNERNPKFD